MTSHKLRPGLVTSYAMLDKCGKLYARDDKGVRMFMQKNAKKNLQVPLEWTLISGHPVTKSNLRLHSTLSVHPCNSDRTQGILNLSQIFDISGDYQISSREKQVKAYFT